MIPLYFVILFVGVLVLTVWEALCWLGDLCDK
jgi:hypothetical protein